MRKSSETSSDTQMSAGVSMKSTSAVRYNDNMMSSTQRITLPPEPPVRSKKPNMTVLPEIVRNSGAEMQGSPSNSSVPSFSPSQSNDIRQLNFAVYGIEGMNDMKKINPKKLLPAPVARNQSSFSQKLLVPVSRVTINDSAKVQDNVSTPQQKELKEQSLSLKRKFISLTRLLV